MEEAYTELYQEFLRLRSLCLRQAALLHQLTAALQKQQGVAAPDREHDLMSIPVHSVQETPGCLREKPEQLTATTHNPAAQCNHDELSRNEGTFSDLLAADMSGLCMDLASQTKENGNLEQNIAPLRSVDSLRLQGTSSNVSKNPGPADHYKMMHTVMMPMSEGPTLPGDLLCPSSGMLMSDVALQSHTCEFCNAVFPGDTTTRGDFLRHLYTHVT
ncbi:hypothetical protein L3Q82_025012 [Xyrichtys novacula]|uniref:Uncharacterized protein n=1 Tax=Xyrichtys novacula TaxID=13765 RepID=A0AAV1ET50_XYRNO|nr:hypothetical protein L3Q82_025012 [Xyrichtys novacula]